MVVQLWAATQLVDTASSGAVSSPVENSLAGGQALSATQPPLATCVTAIVGLSDPAKLSTLRERAANPRIKKIVYWLAAARDAGADPAEVIDQAQAVNLYYGSGTVRPATMGFKQRWRMQRERLSPCYTTRLEDVPTARW